MNMPSRRDKGRWSSRERSWRLLWSTTAGICGNGQRDVWAGQVFDRLRVGPWGWENQESRQLRLNGYGIHSELGSSRCLGMGLWPRHISSERSSLLAQRKDLAEYKRQVAVMKPTVEEHW
jgi:hypothetical protein